jgi:hypothetical protein
MTDPDTPDWIADFHEALEQRKEPPATPPPAHTATNPFARYYPEPDKSAPAEPETK